MTQKPESLTCGCDVDWFDGGDAPDTKCKYPALLAENQKLREELARRYEPPKQHYCVCDPCRHGRELLARLTAKGEGL